MAVVLAWGWGGFGQLATGEASFFPKPEEVGSCLSQQLEKASLGSSLVDLSGIEGGGRGYEGFTCVLANASLYAFGANNKGQLGTATSSGEMKLVRSRFDKGVLQVACGSYHTAVLSEDGKVYTFGEGEYGALGTGSLEYEDAPTVVEGLEDIVYVACGDAQTIALSKTGAVYSWGTCWLVPKGTGIPAAVESPPMISVPHCLSLSVSIKSVACGDCHTSLLDEKGRVHTWGWGAMGQLGHGDDRSCYTPKIVESVEERAVQVSCGADFTLIRAEEGRVMVCGNNSDGQCGTGNPSLSRILAPTWIDFSCTVIEVKAGPRHAVALTEEMEGKHKRLGVWAWGSNDQGQIGSGKQEPKYSPVKLDVLGYSSQYSLCVGPSHNILVLV